MLQVRRHFGTLRRSVFPSPLAGEGARAKRGRVRGRSWIEALTPHPARLRQRSGSPPSPARGEGKRDCRARRVQIHPMRAHWGMLHRSRGADAPGVWTRAHGGPGICPRLKETRGTARQAARQSLCCARPFGTARRLSARRPAFLRRRAALFGSPLRPASGLRLRPLSGGRARKPRAASRPAVSELLAAGLCARGRSPGAARERGLLATPAGAGPIPTSRRNRFAPLTGIGRI